MGIELYTILQERRRLVAAGELEDDPISVEDLSSIGKLAIKTDTKDEKPENFEKSARSGKSINIS